ncbi:Protein DAMAGED DNA-BINDING 2 [Acorus gramineus]|uniref:Protein DAMAGED DNA-BINDING 2 n=1 Tax=Acorus gramineus TaxID=55184 RepID=A0AAV9AL38_ACOGR|nr:Protein DAMAGED DNA-BINDING 2 [Acorus gramineus]
MPPQKRATRRSPTPPRVVFAEEETGSDDSSSNSGGEEEEEEEEVVGGDAVTVGEDINGGKSIHEAPISIKITRRVCKVCKGTGHEAGFRGATYIDCPKKPCFLCKLPGHTTMTCPHRVAMEHGVVPAPRRHSRTPLDYVFERQLKPEIPKIKPAFVVPDQVDCAIIKFHSRRITCLEFHPTKNNVVLSGDKKGQLGIWDYGMLHEKIVYRSIHSCILNNMKFNPVNEGTLFTSSSDGTICCTDLETGIPSILMDLNPDGWHGPANWVMLYGMDTNIERGLVLVADNFGYLYLVDARSRMRSGQSILVHKKGTKVVGLHCNPVHPDLLLSCGNDHFARIWDLRRLQAGSCLESLAHGRVVNSAYFSPLTGMKILTTSQDNRIRVWDSIFGNLERPSREVVHSHDFNRHLTPFKAEWDPKDPSESLVVIGRYISENYNGVALHPIDFIDMSTGQLVAEVMEPNITTISPVNKLHPRDDILASGSSRSIFIWRPKEASKPEEEQQGKRFKEFTCGRNEKKSKGKFDDESDDDFGDFIRNCKRSRALKSERKPTQAKQSKSRT